jgi:diadenosine tetraphosphate (Ap4A) HIT family hydrolase
MSTIQKSSQEERKNEDLNTRMEDCLFCKQTKDHSELLDRLIYEDEHYIVSHWTSQNEPSYLGLVLIQTKRHVHDLGDLSDTEALKLGTLIQKISKGLKTTTGAAWTYSYCYMEGFRHVHMFIASRYPTLPKEYVRLDIGKWPEAPLGDERQVAELAKGLRSFM